MWGRRKRKRFVSNYSKIEMKETKEFEYDISIVVPMYNSQDTILRTLESIESQKTQNVKYEVLLIDDGSTDDSSSIVAEFVAKYENFHYHYGENAGVSTARNKGIDLAKGKYIMFLDSDDTIKANTIRSNFEGFEKYQNEADVLAYNLFQKNNENITPHVRNSNFIKKGNVELYDINIFPNLNQCTMNVVIKNKEKNERIYFDANLKQSEDAKFITEMLLEKGKLIFSKVGGYIYDISGYSAVDKYKSPVNIKNMIFEFFESLINDSRHQNNDIVIPYVQSMILYELNWRFQQNTLYPYHLDDHDYQEWMERLKSVFESIEVSTIMSQRGMDFYHKAYWITNFKEKPRVVSNSYGLAVHSGNNKIVDINSVTLVFNNIRPNKDTVSFRGFVKFPFSNLFQTVQLFIKFEEEIYDIELTNSPSGYYKAKEPVATFYDFDMEIPLNSFGKYEWGVKINGVEKPANAYFENEVIFKQHIKTGYVVLPSCVIHHQKAPFKMRILDMTKKERSDILNHQSKLMEKAKQTNLVKFNKYCKYLSMLFKNKRIWLYNDRKGVLDNSYQQFLNDIDKNDGIKRFYILHADDQKVVGIPQKNTLIYGSIKHKIFYYYSEAVLTSFKERFEYSPLSNQAENTFYSEMKRKVIYLQHGILNAHTPWLYGKHKTKFDKFVISTNFEKENLISNYGYHDKDILEGGMARLDKIIPESKQKRILFAPSWRKSIIIEDNNNNRDLNKSNIEETEFYKGIQGILNSKKLNTVLLEAGYIMDVKLHPILTENEAIFKESQSEIKILNLENDFNQNVYKLFITDFSSYVFDFIKNKTKVTFFQPDRDYFLTGNHIYNKLDMDIEDLGEVFVDVEELVRFIKTDITIDFPIQKNKDKFYQKFFSFDKDETCASQVYKNLIEYLE